MGTKSCTKILVVSTRFSCENLSVNHMVEVEDLCTWPFKLTQNMVQKNNDEIKKTQIKSQHLLREKYDTGS